MAFSANVLLARLLSKEDFGRYSLLLTSVMIFACVTRFGLDRLLLKQIAEIESFASRSLLYRLFGNAAMIASGSTCAAIILMLLIIPQFPTLHSSSELMAIIGLSVLSMILTAWLQLSAESFRGFHNLTKATLYDGQRGGVLLASLFLLYLLMTSVLFADGSEKISLTTVLVGYVFIQLMLLAISVSDLVRSELNKRQSVSSVRNEQQPNFQTSLLLASTLPIAAGEILGILMVNGDLWIAGAMVDASSLANWGVTTQLTQVVAMPLAMINLTVISAIPPLYQQGKIKELQSLLQKSATLATLISLLPLGIMILLPVPLISLLYGEQYLAAAVPLSIVAIGKVVFVWTGTCAMALILTGHQTIILINNIISAILLVLLGCYGTYTHGLVGLACASAFVTVFWNLFNWIAARRCVGVWTHGTLRIGWGIRRST